MIESTQLDSGLSIDELTWPTSQDELTWSTSQTADYRLQEVRLIEEAVLNRTADTPHEFPFFLDNSTKQSEADQTMIPKLSEVLKAAENEYFENGMESTLSRRLITLVSRYEDPLIVELAFRIDNNLVDKDVAGEVLYSLGRMIDVSTYDFRRSLLEKSLFHTSIIVRDGAYLGLSFLRDPRSQRTIREAIERETNPALREDLEHLLDELEHMA